jgi:hypothetical protein
VKKIDIARIRRASTVRGRYEKQLERLKEAVGSTDCIEQAVNGTLDKMRQTNRMSMAIYGDPQSGKTEMMICLTAKLLDSGHSTIVHLMNDNVDLMTQNLGRFRESGIAPLPLSLSEFLVSTNPSQMGEIVVFCKKNGRDLAKLLNGLGNRSGVIVIDDEADFATPNGKVNQGTKTKINQLVGNLMGDNGHYIGVTATPARLDLNRTMENDTDKWVYFPPHKAYTGPNHFFPLPRQLQYRLTLIGGTGEKKEIVSAVLRFLVTSAYLNLKNGKTENFSMLVHTSGRKEKHEEDRKVVESVCRMLRDKSAPGFDKTAQALFDAASTLFPAEDPNGLAEYVVRHASLIHPIVLNSERDRKALGDTPTNPRSPFTIIIGGNIVSRGVTFPNLLSMLFTRDVATRMQQDTYIQRARMFGARGKYLQHFELSIPRALYNDWHRCFVFHRLAFSSIQSGMKSPVWIGDARISVTSSASVNRATVSVDAGEIGFAAFDWISDLDALVSSAVSDIALLRLLQRRLGKEALPEFVIQFIEELIKLRGGKLVVHKSMDVSGWGKDTDKSLITRSKGFLGKNQLKVDKYPNTPHHVRIVRDGNRRARLFYKYLGDAVFMKTDAA